LLAPRIAPSDPKRCNVGRFLSRSLPAPRFALRIALDVSICGHLSMGHRRPESSAIAEGVRGEATERDRLRLGSFFDSESRGRRRRSLDSESSEDRCAD
jgi:hypothetical protein